MLKQVVKLRYTRNDSSTFWLAIVEVTENLRTDIAKFFVTLDVAIDFNDFLSDLVAVRLSAIIFAIGSEVTFSRFVVRVDQRIVALRQPEVLEIGRASCRERV